MLRFLCLLPFFITLHAIGQPSDVLLLKKHHKTIRRYFAGTEIDFTTNTGAYINGQISQIKNDSLFVKVFVVRQTPTQLGVYVLDTVTTYHYKYHYNQVTAIGRSGKKFNMSASAASLMGGGALLVVGSGVVYLVDRKNFSAPLMIASAGLAGVGFLLAKTGIHGMTIGKKYSLAYLSLSANEKN